MTRRNALLLLPGLIAPLMASGCVSTSGMTIESRYATAQEIGASAAMTRQDIKAGPFVLARWQKLTDPQAPVTVYIEGDGLAWLSRTEPSLNPTPKNPVGFNLAASDTAPNVVYIARPCQYNRANVAGNEACADSAYWRGKRFAPEVIAAYTAALNAISAQHPGGFHLVGYSGGANIAGLAARGRQDILSLRTVAGNVDNDYFTRFHDVSDMPLSLNMAKDKSALQHIPQRHFIGGEDTTIPPAIFSSYAQGMTSSCVHSTIVQSASHEEGWVAQWPSLLSIPVTCE